MSNPGSVPSARSTPKSDREVGVAALAWARASGERQDLARLVEVSVRRLRRRRRWLSVACGACAVVAGAGWIAFRESSQKRLADAAAVFAPVAEDRFLPDGSRAELSREARIRLDFDDAARRVTLLAGRAHFAVLKNPARPFIVSASGVDVRAVGTAFVVEVSAGEVGVLVTEGRVTLDRVGSTSGRSADDSRASHRTLAALGVGERARIAIGAATKNGPPDVERLSADEIARALAWRVPMLTLSKTPLSELIPLFNRYGSARLALEPQLNDLRLGGFLRADNTPVLLQLLRDEFGIAAERRGDTVWLTRK